MLFESDTVLRIRISIHETNLAQLARSPRTYVPGTIVEGARSFLGVGVHLKGGERSAQPLFRRPSFSLKFNTHQVFYGLQRIKLNNCKQDPSGLNQIVSSWVFNAAGVPCPRATAAIVELNGRNLGLYEFEEGVDTRFLKRNFAVEKAALYQGAYGIDIDGPAEKTHGEVVTSFQFSELHRILAAPAENQSPDRLMPFVDADRFYRFMACEILTGHSDGYCMGNNNYRFFIPAKDLSSPTRPGAGPMIFIPHGMDQTWANPRSAALPISLTKLPRAFLSTPAGRERFRYWFARSLSNGLDLVRIQARITKLQGEIQPILKSIDPEAAKQQDIAARELINQLHIRQEHLTTYFSAPSQRLEAASGFQLSEPGTTGFRTVPSGIWLAHEQVGNCALFRTNNASGPATMAVVAIQSSTYSSQGTWRAKILLPAGHYQFKGRVKVLYSSQMAQAVLPDLYFQVYNGRREPKAFPKQNQSWVDLSTDLDVADAGETVELVIGLQGFTSGLLFDLNSMAIENRPL